MKNTTLAIAVVAGLVASTLTTISTQASGYGYGYGYASNGSTYVPYNIYEVPTRTDIPGTTPGTVVERATKRILQIPLSISTENNNEEVIIPDVLPETGVELVYRVIKLINTPHTPSA